MAKVGEVELVGEGLGEVVSVEALNDTIGELNERQEIAAVDHAETLGGSYAHDGPRWATAIATVDCVDPSDHWSSKKFIIRSAHGFASIDTEQAAAALDWREQWVRIKWTLDTPGIQVVTMGIAVDPIEHLSHVTPFGFDFRKDWAWSFKQTGESAGELKIDAALPSGVHDFEGPLPAALTFMLKRIWIAVRVV